MRYVNVGTENDTSIKICHEDHGSDLPVLIHGYPLNSDSWGRQELEFLSARYRVIGYDGRGFGKSSRESPGLES